MLRPNSPEMVKLALALCLTALPAQAAWLHCAATGSNGAGPFEYLATLARVDTVSPQRLQQFQTRLAKYVAKADADAQGVKAQCYASDDQITASEHYSRLLNDAAARLGWDRVVVVAPRTWLDAGDIVDEPAQP